MFFLNFSFGFRLKNNFLQDFLGFLILFFLNKTTGNGVEYDELGLVGLLACRGLCALIPLARCHLRTILIILFFC